MKLRTYPVGPTMPLLALVGWAATIAGIAIIVHELGDVHVKVMTIGVVLLVGVGPIGLYATLALIVGTGYLAIDPAAGTARFVRLGSQVWSHRLSELPALTIHGRGSRFELRAGDDAVFRATTRQAAAARMTTIEELIARSAVRSILATAERGGDGVFRAQPDLLERVTQAVPDPARRHAALDALASDEDPEIRARVATLKGTP